MSRPLVRDSRKEPLRPTDWDDALGRIVAALNRSRAVHGRDSVGWFGSGPDTAAHPFREHAGSSGGTSSIEYDGIFPLSAAAWAPQAFGLNPGLPIPTVDLAAADAVLVVGSIPADPFPQMMQVYDAARFGGVGHVLMDPAGMSRRTIRHLQPRPGTDLVLAKSMLHIAISEKLIDEDYIAERTVGFEAIRHAAERYSPDRDGRLTGIPGEDLVDSMRALANAQRGVVLAARDVEQHCFGLHTITAFNDLALALGLPERRFSGYRALSSRGGVLGGRTADQLPGYGRLDDPVARRHLAAVWGIDTDDVPQPGLSVDEMLGRLGADDGVRALWVVASNIVVSAPASARVAERLEALDFLVVSDSVFTETAALADVVLPSAVWAEKTRPMTAPNQRPIRREDAVRPLSGVRTDPHAVRKPGRWRVGTGSSDSPGGTDRRERRWVSKVLVGLLVLGVVVSVGWLAVSRANRPPGSASVSAAVQPPAEDAAGAWITANLPADALLLTDGPTPPSDYPTASLTAALDWRSFDYLITYDDTDPALNAVVAQVRRSSIPAALFDGLQVRRIVGAPASTLQAPDAELADRLQAGRALLSNPSIAASPDAGAVLARGQLDLRAATTLTALAAQLDVRLDEIDVVAPEAAAGVPARSLTIHSSDSQRATSVLSGLIDAFRPDQATTEGDGALRLHWPLSFTPIPSVN